jgi:hypothetical protein
MESRAWLLAAILAVCVPLAGCTSGAPRYTDVRFPVSGARRHYPHAVDGAGNLWYLAGDRVVRATSPAHRTSARDPSVRDGSLFAYAGAVYAVDGDGTALTRFGDRLHRNPVAVPRRYVPVEGGVADARHRWVVLAQSSPHRLAVIDVWKWYDERLPSAIAPFSASLAGGPHGKKYLVAGDQRRPLLVVKDRWTQRSVVVHLPSNACFGSGAGAWKVPVDVRGRDATRAWATSGSRALSVDLNDHRILRVWHLGGCAMHVLRAGAGFATILIAQRRDGRYVSSLVRVDRAGVEPLRQYGQIEGLAGGAMLDRNGRLWWFDSASNAFVRRTPVG